jgi:hypothetical protein
MRSRWSAAKNASQAASSSADVVAPIEIRMPASRQRSPKQSETYCEPWSEVVHEPDLRLARADRYLETLDDELGAHGVGHLPADHPPAEVSSTTAR